jgi:ADP-heptose:LPS heptosyltransferase
MASAFYTEKIDPGNAVHIIARNMALARAVGFVTPEIRLPLAAGDNMVSQRTNVAVMNPGAGWPNKQWHPARFGQLASAIRQRHGLRSVVTWGPGEESLAHAVVQASDGAAEAAPATSLASLMALLRSATVVVSGDTGPIHLAAAAGTPVVGIYGPTDPRRNGPWSPLDETVSRFDTCVCHHKRRCHRASRCLDDIEMDDVFRAVSARLGKPDGLARRS